VSRQVDLRDMKTCKFTADIGVGAACGGSFSLRCEKEVKKSSSNQR
jgi:hypothetical protein